ncbi:TIR domain-containing adapter molecule 1-like [Symphorus nematophorus]
MSHKGQETQGTGLRDVFDILIKAPPERLLSLTFQLGESPEDNIVHALCLIVLQKQAQALNKLQMLRDNHLAKHLSEKLQTSGGKLENFAVHCGQFQEFTGESLAALARIFKVLSEQRLCDPLLRNLAYKRALSTDGQKIIEDLEYDQLREEAKDVCGPPLAEWMCSPTHLKSYHDIKSSLDGHTTLKVTLSHDQSGRAHSLPSPLQTSSSMPSYPTHLEISIPTTASFPDDKKHPETSDKSILNTPVVLVSEFEAENASGRSQISTQPPTCMFGAKKDSSMDETLVRGSITLDSLISPTQTTNPTTEPKFAPPAAANCLPPLMPVANEMHESSDADEEEEEAIFYAFVIFHAPEDADLADRLKEKVETVISSEGATFSEDFATPGRSTLRCVADAIDNTAFTFLLLTRNFTSRMQELETNSALINSINKKHKFNTVIPLLPRENRMPRENIPLPLQTMVPLEENRSFERKIQKSLSPMRIDKLRKIWIEEQRVKMQRQKQQRLKQSNQLKKQLLKESKKVELLEKEQLWLSMEQNLVLSPNVAPEQQQQRSIHIQNAKYIMIGSNSQMIVGGGADEEDSIDKEEEQ